MTTLSTPAHRNRGQRGKIRFGHWVVGRAVCVSVDAPPRLVANPARKGGVVPR